jgi:sugar fermentation stimulation protein A
VQTYCPNPGRLMEILVAGRKVLLERRPGTSPERAGRTPGPSCGSPDRLPYLLAAARYRDEVIPLNSTRINDIAEQLILPALFPALLGFKREVRVAGSRLDFLLDLSSGRRSRLSSKKLYLEAKGCTLTEEGTAMFPDAPTLRGLKHLQALETLADQGREAGILFVLMNPRARRFVPNLHTDPAFARKLISLQDKIWMRAVAIRTGLDGCAAVTDLEVPLDLTAAEAAFENRGAYLLIIRLRRSRRITPGSLGDMLLPAGFYVYVGSAMGNLEARIARHRRRRKILRWHIDYLLAEMDSRDVRSLVVRSLRRLECSLAEDLARLADGSVARFGSSDCACPSHLFRFVSNPLENQGFLDLLLHYRHTVAIR